jgi:hypothetical protein
MTSHASGAAQAMDRYSGCTFTSPDNLAKHILSSAILDLLVKAQVLAYAEESGRARDVAEGFIHEMAQKVAGDRNLDLEGMQRAVRNAIDIYAREIAGGQAETNYDAIVDEALSWARSLVDAGKSGLARATLRKASEALRQQEEERRERYVAQVTALGNGERDRALAAYDGEAACDAIVALAEALHGANAARAVPRSPSDEASATSLEPQRAALEEQARERVPLDWAANSSRSAKHIVVDLCPVSMHKCMRCYATTRSARGCVTWPPSSVQPAFAAAPTCVSGGSFETCRKPRLAR